jgi:hypothetical protein
MEADAPLRGVRLEVRRGAADQQGHGFSPFSETDCLLRVVCGAPNAFRSRMALAGAARRCEKHSYF